MIPYIDLSFVRLGSVQINLWGLMVGLGFLLTIFLAEKRAPLLGFDRRRILDLGLWVFFAAMVGGRLGYVFFYHPGEFALHPIEIMKVWNGGLSSIGGMVGGLIAFFILTRKKKEDRLRLSDVYCYAWPAGWTVGRLGCFFIHDHVGNLSNSFFAVAFPSGPRLDLGLLEALAAGVLTLLVYGIFRKPPLRGTVTGVVAVGYGLMRFFLDFLRAADLPFAEVRYGGFTPAQYASIALVAAGCIFIVRRTKERSADRFGAGVV